MIKYIQEAINKLKSRIAGMKANPDKWLNQEVKVVDMEGELTVVEAQSAKVDAAEASLQVEQSKAKNLVETLNHTIKQVDNLAYGIHANETAKLAEYGIPLRKSRSTKPLPGKVMITSITSAPDGEGFVINWDKIASADHYEIEKGVAPNSTDKVLAPPYTFFKSTTKVTLTDDDVEMGRRYFYRVRAMNATGAGEWSEPVNIVQ